MLYIFISLEYSAFPYLFTNPLGTLGNNSVPKRFQSSHPIGNPIIHVTKWGFRRVFFPICFLCVLYIAFCILSFLLNTPGEKLFFESWAVGVGRIPFQWCRKLGAAWFAVAVGVGNTKPSFTAVGRSKITSADSCPFCIIPDLGKASKYFSSPQSNDI